MLRKLPFAALVLVLAAVTGRAGDQTIVDEIIARVDNSIITRADYAKAEQAALTETQQQFPSNWQTKWSERQKDTLRGLIDQQLLLDKGKELGITGDTQVVKRLNEMRIKMGFKTMDELEEEAKKQGIAWEDFKEQIRASVVSEQVIGQEVGAKLNPTTAEAQAWYNQHQKDMEGPEEVSLSEILVATPAPKPVVENQDKDHPAPVVQPTPDPAAVAAAEAKAKSLLEQLRKGAKFEDLAKQTSDGTTAAEGGRLGEFKRGELVKDYEDKTFSLKPGEYTDLIQTKQGFIILKVNAHRPAGVPPFKEVEPRVKEAVYTEKLEPAARAYLSKLRDEAFIDIKPGYVDAGASPNQANKPVVLPAAGTPAAQASTPKKKKKKFGVF